MENKYKGKISIVTVNYNGKEYLKPLLDSLKLQTYPNFEIIFVDNASTDDSVNFVKKNYPAVKIVRKKKNLGFAGGNNSALPYCTGEYVALINNDMVANKDWLRNLHKSLQDNNADVIGPKILFYKPFITLNLNIKTFVPSDNGLGKDRRELGCMVGSDLFFDNVNYKKTLFLENTFNEENDGAYKFHWVSDKAIIKAPIDLKLVSYKLKIKLAVSDFQKKERVKIFIGKEIIFDKIIDNKTREYIINIDRKVIHKHYRYVINNASSAFSLQTGFGKDIGMYEDDEGQYDISKKAFSLCGGSMLIKKDVINKLGLFDEYFFAYYEDTDFCWRLKNKNKKLFYEPSAVVYHIHTGTSKEWSPFFIYHVERNRLAMLLKNAKAKNIFKELMNFFFQISKDFLVIIKSENSKESIERIRVKAYVNLLLNLPVLLYERWKINFKN